MMTMVDIDPCPFCESVNIAVEGYHLTCLHCGADGPDADNKSPEALAAAWNRRAQPQATQPQEELRQPEPPTPMCKCGEKPAADCDEEWGPNCDLGNNAKYARRAPDEVTAQVNAASSQEKPRPEPVAWMKRSTLSCDWDAYDFSANPSAEFSIPLYAGAEPVARQPLTEEQVDKLDTFALHVLAPLGQESVRNFARAIERAHGIPATPAPRGGE